MSCFLCCTCTLNRSITFL